VFASNPADDSRVRELRALIAALHARGIGVIMDVVYNHTSDNALFPFVVPHYYYRHMADGSLANGSGCGNEFRTEAPMARKFIVESLKFWAKEYDVDGFRFDLMALVDQETMREAEREPRASNPNIVLYGEPWAAGATPLGAKTDKAALHQVPVGAFNDDFRNALKGSPDGRDAGFIQNGSKRDSLKNAMLVSAWLDSPAQSINYMTCHDNLVLYDKLKVSMPGASEQQLKDAMKLGYLALFTAQGVPFIHGGEEFARSKGGNANSYDAPDSVNQVDWSLKRKNFDLFAYVRDLIALRKAHPVFRLRTRGEIAARLRFENAPDDKPNEKTLVFTLDGSGVPGEMWKRICVALNAGESDAEITLPGGQWTVALDERGASPGRVVSHKISVRQKSGLVLYQR
jgi:pullulanase